MGSLYSLLENPKLHDLCQKALAAGRGKALRIVEKFLSENCAGRILDLGCGTARYSHLFPKGYVGMDINAGYLRDKTAPGKAFVCADSGHMPFKDGLFDTIFSVGVFHHIRPEAASMIFGEMNRVARRGAKIFLIDFFYPCNALDVPGWLVSKLDRGRFVRAKEHFADELGASFDLIGSQHIKYSYPYNLHVMELKQK